MTLNNTEFKKQAILFLEELFSLIDQNQIRIEKHWNIDHLCFRTATDDDYHQLKQQFLIFSKLLIESEVNGRMISTFKLPEPVKFRDWSIDLVELPAPKKGKTTIQGFEHIEIVVDIPLNQIKKMYPSCTFDDGGMKKLFNQELEISFGKLAMKFHPLSLESVINIEKNPKLFAAIINSGVLLDFKDYSPLVSGTFPLDIAVETSDVDIIMTSDSLEKLSEKINKHYSHCADYSLRTDNDYITAKFSFADFVFEIYAERTASSLQNSNLHFLVEERLLKLGPTSFRKHILRLKESGVKTEQAFATQLNLSGDPYQALLDIRKKSEAELQKLFA